MVEHLGGTGNDDVDGDDDCSNMELVGRVGEKRCVIECLCAHESFVDVHNCLVFEGLVCFAFIVTLSWCGCD